MFCVVALGFCGLGGLIFLSRQMDGGVVEYAPTYEAAPARSSKVEPTPKPKDEWVSVVGKIDAGVKVYYRGDGKGKPDLWFTVLSPYMQDDDGTIYMQVKWAATGKVEYTDRRKLLRSPAAMNGWLVTKKGDLR